VDILVLVTERGLKIQISNIEFSFGSDRIKRRGKWILTMVSGILKKYSRYKITIEGHTDDVGKEEFNLGLSERRARAVKKFLMLRGISGARMKYVGMGETTPIYPNTSEENRRRNRRVEFLLEKEDDL
jgi:outer membrane protein OmpA-like peptidoglycan-associated protein